MFPGTASGAKAARPGLDEALSYARKGDVLVVWRLDCLGRSLPELVKIVGELEAAGLASRVSRNGSKPARPPAGFERRLIVERTHAGLAAARARGRKGGRPVLPPEKVAAIQAMAAGNRSLSEI